MAGEYTPGVPDAGDTDSAPDTTGMSTGSFDELSMFGVSPNLSELPIIWKRNPKKRVMMDLPEGGEGPAFPERYEDADEKQTYQDSVCFLYAQAKDNPDGLGDLQLQMAAGGFYGKNPYFIPKSADPTTSAKWQDILKMAMREGKTPQEIIDDAVAANGGLEEGLKKHGMSSTGTLSDVHLTHPDDIRMVAKEVSRKTLGKGWDAKQLEAFVTSYQSMETQAGRAAQGSGATVVNPPSLEAATEAEARRQNPVAAGATDWDGAAQMMMKAFRTLSGGE